MQHGSQISSFGGPREAPGVGVKRAGRLPVLDPRGAAQGPGEPCVAAAAAQAVPQQVPVLATNRLGGINPRGQGVQICGESG